MFNCTNQRVLIEEGTGTWCSWCPRGFVFGEQMVYEYDAIVIGIHMNDIMESAPEYADATNMSGLPAGNVDRVAMRVDPIDWETSVIAQLNNTPPADISVTTTFNAATRNLTMTVTAEFFVALNGDYRLGAVVVEDAVTGTTSGYNQSNAYSGGSTPMGGWENLPDPVPAKQMVYDHVARYLASDYAGDPSSLPATIAAGSQHSHTLSFTLPADYNEEYVHVVGYITQASTGAILNAGKSAYLLGNTNAQPMFVSEGKTNGLVGVNYQYDILTHDPDNLNLTITAEDIPSWMTFTTTGPKTASLFGTPSTEGTYPVTLKVSDGNSSRLQVFEVEIINSGGVDWYLVGDEGFTPGSAASVNLKMNSSGVPYVMSASSNNQVSVYKFENETWSVLGAPINGSENQAAMALAPDSTPYVFTGDGTLKMYRFDGTTWTQVGGTVGEGYHIDMTIANDGTPYVSYMDIANEAKGVCKKWDGSTWVTVGDSTFSTQVAVWTKITTNNNNQPVILYGTGGSNGPFFSNVTEFNGSSWQIIGGGNIDSTVSTYFSHSIAMDANGKIYVSLTTDTASKQLNVYQWNGTAWTQIGENISGGGTYDNTIALDLQGNPVIGFRDELEGGKTTVMRFDQNSWATVGLAGFSNIASFQSLAYSPDGAPYIAYQDETNNSKATVKRYGPETLNIIDQPDYSLDLTVYPNPNSGEFTLLSNYEGHFQLVDLQGRIISEGKLKDPGSQNGKNAYSFKYDNLPKGLYLMNIVNDQKRKVVKIIIE